MSSIWGVALIFAVTIFATAFVSYWTGKDAGSKQAYHWKKKYEDEHNERLLLRKQCDGLIHEIDMFLPKNVWRNERWHPSDGRYGVFPDTHPSGYRSE